MYEYLLLDVPKAGRMTRNRQCKTQRGNETRKENLNELPTKEMGKFGTNRLTPADFSNSCFYSLD